METKMRRITIGELFDLFYGCAHTPIAALIGRPDVSHIVVFEDLALEHMNPNRVAVAIGPGCTYKTLADIEGQHLGDLPSQRRYPVAYYEKEV